MDQQIKYALQAGISGFNFASALENKKVESDKLYRALLSVFEKDAGFIEKLAEMDAVFDEYSEFENLREFMFDLLMINFFSSDAQKLDDDYLESEEWEEIENDTLDRGTEFLNLLLYIKECKEEGIDPELNDYLKEFLLVDEDEFQDEHMIYEDVIANQLLVEAAYSEIAKVADKLPAESELKYVFYPLIAFFANPDHHAREMEEFLKSSTHKSHDLAVLSALNAYHSGLDSFDKTFLTIN